MKRFCFLLAVFFVSYFPKAALCEESKLTGLRGVWVVITVNTEDIKNAGGTEDLLKTEVEILLRKYGIPILSYEEFKVSRGSLLLQFQGGYIKTATGELYGYVVDVGIAAMEPAFFERDIQNSKLRGPFFVSTWSNSSFAIVPVDKIRDGCIDALEIVTKKFINAYLTANNKKKTN